MNAPLFAPRLLTIAALVLALGAPVAWSAQANAQAARHESAATPSLALDHGRKWTIDPHLAKAMKNIRDVMQKEVDAIDGNRVAKKSFRVMARKINGEIAYIVKNCNLPPASDAQLHLVIAELQDGVAAMEGQDELGTRHDGALRVLTALENYGTYFDDPQFEPIRH